jgi:hypothetical protein
MHIREIPVLEYRRWLASLPATAPDADPARSGIAGSAAR